MAGSNHNDESQTGPNPITRVHMDPDVPMTAFRERPETLRPKNGNGSHSYIG